MPRSPSPEEEKQMTVLSDSAPIADVGELRSGFGGDVLTPADPAYEPTRQVFNAMYDRRPAAIARCAGVADVIAALRFARERGLQIAVRGGGHSVQGYSSCDGGIIIDLSPMKGVRVDPAGRTAWAQAGLTWGELDRETQAFGLAVTGGRVSTTGIVGQTIGSGSGWLERLHGLTCDNLISADVVTADGRLVRASEREHPELLWGLRGAGGNFGIVTSLEYRLHPVGPVVYGGMLLYRRDRAAELLRLFRDHMDSAPDELCGAFGFMTAPPEPFVPSDLQLQPAVGVIVCHVGDAADGERLVRPFRKQAPAVDLVGPLPYTEVQKLLDPTAPFGRRHYWKVEAVRELTDDAIATLVGETASMPGPFSLTILEPGGRAIARVGEDATPISSRAAAYRYYAVAIWENPDEDTRHVEWARGVGRAMEPFSTVGVQLNFVPDEGIDRVRSTFGEEKYARLVALKRRYDPANVFRLNQNIDAGPPVADHA
jgi:FAD/FMN-containing dehydrogenase